VFQFSGLSYELVLGLSLDQFRSLYGSCERLDATEKRLDAWTTLIASQASGKDMKKWAKMWDAVIEGRDDDAARLVDDLGSGI